MKSLLEDIFVTEGVPQYTFVKPPNYNDILVDIRKKGKPVIIEGQSGTGKTTTAKRIIQQLNGAFNLIYLTARNFDDISTINDLIKSRSSGYYIIDDFHRLDTELQKALAEITKLSAETQDENLPKLIIIGINQVGSSLINLVSDISKRCGIHRIEPGSEEKITELIKIGAEKLNIKIEDIDKIYDESKGDYWLTQSICQTICSQNDVIEEQDIEKEIHFELESIRHSMIIKLSHTYKESVKEFCRGRRFRPSNDPYYKLLKLISGQDNSIVDLNELANAYPESKASINGIKEKRLQILLESKELCSRYFFFNTENKNFAIEDPALFYFLKHVDWEGIRKECGFRDSDEVKEYDLAISFAGENRNLAKFIADKFEEIEVKVFYDEYYESNFLGKTWSKEFERIFLNDSKYVICLLDNFHKSKIWPTFERECFSKRIGNEEVIPIYLDDSIFVGIPSDIVGIKFDWSTKKQGNWHADAEENIIYKIWEKLD